VVKKKDNNHLDQLEVEEKEQKIAGLDYDADDY